MRIKAAFLVGGAVGYVLGTRAGREQFDKIQSSAKGLWQDPRVQETVSGVTDRATGFLDEKAPDIKGKLTGAVQSATGRSGKGEHVAEETTDSYEAGGDLTADGYRPAGPTSLS